MGYKVQKPCKVCGKLYTPCADCENNKGVFHWRTVACSQECASKYFDMVISARNKETIVVVEEKKEISSDDAEIVSEKPKRVRKAKIKNDEESEQIE